MGEYRMSKVWSFHTSTAHVHCIASHAPDALQLSQLHDAWLYMTASMLLHGSHSVSEGCYELRIFLGKKGSRKISELSPRSRTVDLLTEATDARRPTMTS